MIREDIMDCWMDGWMFGWIRWWMDGWMNGWMEGACMHKCTDTDKNAADFWFCFARAQFIPTPFDTHTHMHKHLLDETIFRIVKLECFLHSKNSSHKAGRGESKQGFGNLASTKLYPSMSAWPLQWLETNVCFLAAMIQTWACEVQIAVAMTRRLWA